MGSVDPITILRNGHTFNRLPLEEFDIPKEVKSLINKLFRDVFLAYANEHSNWRYKYSNIKFERMDNLYYFNCKNMKVKSFDFILVQRAGVQQLIPVVVQDGFCFVKAPYALLRSEKIGFLHSSIGSSIKSILSLSNI